MSYPDPVATKSRPPPPMPPVQLLEYAFTEITTFFISQEAVIDDDTTYEGNIWADIIRTYGQDPGTGLVWWGRSMEPLNVLKLVVDWQTPKQHRQFEESSADLRESWKHLTIQPVKTSYYVFPNWVSMRQNAFSTFRDRISVILTFHFPSAFDDPLKVTEWGIAWDQFSYSVLRSGGGNISSNTCGGWAIDRLSYCGVVRHIDIRAMKAHLSDMECFQLMSSGIGNPGPGSQVMQDYGFSKLMILANQQMDIEFASMYCLEHGWLNSVTTVKRDDP